MGTPQCTSRAKRSQILRLPTIPSLHSVAKARDGQRASGNLIGLTLSSKAKEAPNVAGGQHSRDGL